MNDLLLWDNALAVGKVVIESDDGMLLLGDFIRFAEYEKYRKLFDEYEAAANDQLLVEIDRLDKIIAACEFRVTELDGSRARRICDVQIGSSRISFRWM